MGGPMSVHDEEKHPWLKDEKRFIKKCIVADKKILGVCLGSQLAADALGARVYKNKEKEIGWFAIRKTAARHPVSYHWPKEAMVFHWHGDTFDLPKGAIHLAESDACKHQAFIWNNQILALQCHFEVEPEHVEEFIATGKKELAAGGTYVQASAQIRAGARACRTDEADARDHARHLHRLSGLVS